jgi:hypothetical protein
VSSEPARNEKTASVEAYKSILRNVLDRRPSGTRQRLASALGKNRSFISQISNPAYPVPIPALHLEIIFDICHFSGAEKREFLECFARAHPARASAPRNGPSLRALRLDVVDFGDARRNREFDNLISELARRLGRLATHSDGNTR